MISAEITGQPNTTTAGKRKWMYPLIRKGKFYQYRSWLSYAYLIILFTGPFIRINGHPLLLINVIERRFVLFGQVFWPQDFFIFVIIMLLGMVCVILFTIAFGRVFCGWICPQTIFMEMVFRKIEVLIEGSPKQRRLLDNSPWTAAKVKKKASKHFLFIVLSFLIANTFLAYIIGSDSLIKIITEPVSLHLSGFISIWVFTTVFYLVYSQMRELVCTVACPYGRLQDVLIDKQTLVVAYNYLRGEPRGKRVKAENASSKGDCVDCGLCVDVCPTGIDIRKGTQLECINCTACIDACNQVMEKINRPLNLIGFYSEETIAENKKPVFTKRMMAYSAIMVVLLGVLIYFIAARTAVDVNILRSAGTLYQEQPGGYISNIYNAEITNKSNKAQQITLQPEQKDVVIKYIQPVGTIDAEGTNKAVFFIMMPGKSIRTTKTTIKINVMQQGKVLQTIESTFTGPIYDN
ncbi:cytochrome c oxidase accessory protein CcoG [Mucilaginibacter limnophilus]|uniref:Cytochrome c oxidase accessory protein CcoG n=1 Tax=Mucilaginibacter limnophilus TaxID=1932778 RepID=A0A3S2Y3R1_9SPHI|nr:cytochrome c oxidase accessory protein CcoG [Mucilaginibacter limnophilus]RVU02845.1 cytochrome c oxidase accessory protein CcoG [Mucilaginibacter limnophilus]